MVIATFEVVTIGFKDNASQHPWNVCLGSNHSPIIHSEGSDPRMTGSDIEKPKFIIIQN